jgi:murein L,D-transpeptidase YafK
VDKNKNTLYMLEVKGDKPEIVKEISVLTGENNSDKMEQGDLSTPEGVYFITRFITPAELSKAYGMVAEDYGAGAFPLNYPNIVDKINSKTGGGIWLHGVKENRQDNATKGCVAMSNDMVVALKPMLSTGTPVVISKDIDFEDTTNYLAEKAFLKDKFNTLIESWEGSDFDKFASFYHTNFKSTSGEKYQQFLAKKKALMKLYPERKIETSAIRIFKENGSEYVYDFDQLYCADNILAYGNKRLYFEKEVDEFKIIAEEYRGSSAEHIVKERAAAFLVDWKKAWESMDSQKYMSHYAPDFSSEGFNYEKWKEDKAEKFEKYSSISVGVENIEISQIAPKKLKVRFLQRFKGDSYSDTGFKTLILEGCPGDYRIISEVWRAR